MHYSGEVENVCTTSRQIYPGQCVQNFIRIGQVCRRYDKNILVSPFFGSQFQLLFAYKTWTLSLTR